MKTIKHLALAAFVASGLVAAPAGAQDYAGETVSILVNYPSGGPTDIEARIVAQYLGKHIPGEPTVIVNNMGGGGGNIAANYLGEVASDDHTVISFFTWNPMDQIMGAPGLRVKYSDFKLIAGFQQPVVAYMRKDTPPGIDEPADIASAEEFNVATLAPNNHVSLRQALALDLLGADYNMIAGYKGLKDVETAILQNEAQFAASSIAGYRGSITPTMVEPGHVIPVFHFDIQNDAGEYEASPALPEVPTFLTLYKDIKGEDQMPSGIEWETLSLINGIMDSLYRTVFMAPGVPDEAVETMREAFASLAKDPEFRQAYEKTVGIEPTVVTGEQGAAIIERLGSVDPELTQFVTDYVAKIGQ